VATLPIARRGILFEKVATLTVQAVVLAFVIMLCTIVGRGFDLALPISHLAGISLGIALLGIDFGLLAILVESRTGSREVALGVTSAIAAASYLFSSLAPLLPGYDRRGMRPFSTGQSETGSSPPD
jgi:ABC-2 type transport system permease protein